MRKMSNIGIAAMMALMQAETLQPGPGAYSSSKATVTPPSPERLSKAEKKRERKARQRARLAAKLGGSDNG